MNIMKTKKKVIYLDQAATSFPKPEHVVRAVCDCMTHYCGNPGRGSHELAIKSARKVYECRKLLGKMFGAEPERVIFTLNTTYAINMVIKGIMSDGDHMLISNFEHNSVYRPVRQMERDGIISFDIFDVYKPGCEQNDDMILENISSKIRPNTRLIFCTHTSNICSFSLPIKKIGKLCRENNILFGVDAAQSAGHSVIDMREMNIDFLCMPAHKGLLGPQGCGILIFGENVTPSSLSTLIEGGNGINSLEDFMGDDSPERFEAGTVSTPSIAGLCEGLKFLENYGIENISKHCITLWNYAYARLSENNRIKIYAPEYSGSILLFNILQIPSDLVGEELNLRGICVRTGFHCSSLGHKTLKTDTGGAVRVSFGVFNTLSDAQALAQAVNDISESGVMSSKKIENFGE